MPRQSVVVSDPEILGGTPCFRGTRVPVDSLIDYLEAGDSLDEFLDNFPSVSREAAIAALEEAAQARNEAAVVEGLRRMPIGFVQLQTKAAAAGAQSPSAFVN